MAKIGAYRRKTDPEDVSYREEDEDGSWLTGSAPYEIRQNLKRVLSREATTLSLLESILGE